MINIHSHEKNIILPTRAGNIKFSNLIKKWRTKAGRISG